MGSHTLATGSGSGLLPMLIGANIGPSNGDYDYFDNLLSNPTGSKSGGTNTGLSIRRSYNGGTRWPCTFQQSSASGDPARPCASFWSQSSNDTAIQSLGTGGTGGAEVTNWTSFFNSIPSGHLIYVSLEHEVDIKAVTSTTAIYLQAQVNLRAALAASNKASSPNVQLGVILTYSGYDSTPGPATWINTTSGVLDWCGCDSYYYYEPDTGASAYPYPASDWGHYTLAKMTPANRYSNFINFANANGLDKLVGEWNAHPDPSDGANPGGYRPKLIHDSTAYWDSHGVKASCIFNANVGNGSHIPWWLDAFTNWANRPANNTDHTTFPDAGSLAAYRDVLATHVRYAGS